MRAHLRRAFTHQLYLMEMRGTQPAEIMAVYLMVAVGTPEGVGLMAALDRVTTWTSPQQAQAFLLYRMLTRPLWGLIGQFVNHDTNYSLRALGGDVNCVVYKLCQAWHPKYSTCMYIVLFYKIAFTLRLFKFVSCSTIQNTVNVQRYNSPPPSRPFTRSDG